MAALELNAKPSVSLADLAVPPLDGVAGAGTETAEPPVKPAPTPTKPEVEPEPNTVPAAPPVREPDVAPLPRPPSTCPVGPGRGSGN